MYFKNTFIIYGSGERRAMESIWRAEGSLRETVLSFYHVGTTKNLGWQQVLLYIGASH